MTSLRHVVSVTSCGRCYVTIVYGMCFFRLALVHNYVNRFITIREACEKIPGACLVFLLFKKKRTNVVVLLLEPTTAVGTLLLGCEPSSAVMLIALNIIIISYTRHVITALIVSYNV